MRNHGSQSAKQVRHHPREEAQGLRETGEARQTCFQIWGAEIWFRDKMVPRPQVKGAVPAFRKRDQIGKQPDAGALRAAKKILELECSPFRLLTVGT